MNDATVGTFFEYHPELPLAVVPGTRIVKCQYRAAKKGESARTSAYVRIPDYINKDSVSEHITMLMPHIIEWLQGVEDEAIRKEHKVSGLLDPTFHHSKLGMSWILEQLENAATGQRMTKEDIMSWFNSVVREDLESRFFGKLLEGMGETLDSASEEQQEAALARASLIAEQYAGKFQLLAGTKVAIRKEDAETLRGMLDSLGLVGNDPVGTRFSARLEALAKKEDELLMAL